MFYSNMFLGSQRDPVFTYPYSVSWADGTGVSGSYGLTCSHIDEKQRVFGPPKHNVSASYFINPICIHSMIISARELGKGTKLTLDSMTASSVRAHLSSSNSSEPLISFLLVQGMAYITAEYNGATPLLQTGVFFRDVKLFTQKPKKNVTKYQFILKDGTTWRVYGYKTKGDDLDLEVTNNGVVTSTKPFYGVLQVVKEATTAASKEILQDMIAASDLDSMYFSGKALTKYAFMLYVINDILGETKLAQAGLGQLTDLPTTSKSIRWYTRRLGEVWYLRAPTKPDSHWFKVCNLYL